MKLLRSVAPSAMTFVVWILPFLFASGDGGVDGICKTQLTDEQLSSLLLLLLLLQLSELPTASPVARFSQKKQSEFIVATA